MPTSLTSNAVEWLYNETLCQVAWKFKTGFEPYTSFDQSELNQHFYLPRNFSVPLIESKYWQMTKKCFIALSHL